MLKEFTIEKLEVEVLILINMLIIYNYKKYVTLNFINTKF